MLDIIEQNASGIAELVKLLVKGLNPWSILIGIVCYIIMSLGLSSLAKRRIINHSWLAWIPIGNLWILGCLVDQYHRTVGGKEKSNHADRLFWLGLTSVVLIVAIVVMLVAGLSYCSKNAPVDGTEHELYAGLEQHSGDERAMVILMRMAQMLKKDPDVARSVNIGLIGLSILLVALIAAVIWLAVEQYRALYFLYASCLPRHAVWFLVVSIVLGVEAVFVFICRKQHQGMPHDKKGRIQVI